MSIRTPSPSIFRPAAGIDQSVLQENKALLQEIDRRKILRGAVSLGALTMLTGCDVTNRSAVQSVLKTISSFNDGVQALMFRPNHLAPTFTEARGGQAAALQRLLRDPGRQAGRRRELEARTRRPDRGQAALDRAADLRAAGTGVDHPACLRRGLGLYRAMVGRESARISRPASAPT